MAMLGNGHHVARRVGLLVLLAIMSCGACEKSDNPFKTGTDVNSNPDAMFAKLMQRPSIEEATKNYHEVELQIRKSLTDAIPSLAPWGQSGELSGAGCGSGYQDLKEDGEERALPLSVVNGSLPDVDYEKAIAVIGEVAKKYGFDPSPQRLHDAKGSHDAMFYNHSDGSRISFGAALNTSIRINVGCHLTAKAKARGVRSDGAR